MSLALEELFLYPEFSYCSADSTISIQTRRRQFPIKSPFAQEHTLKHVGIYLPSPLFFRMTNCMWHFSKPDKVAIAIAEGIRQRIGSDRLLSPDIVYREVL